MRLPTRRGSPKWALAAMLFAWPAWAQDMPAPLNQYFIPSQASANAVSNFVFVAPRRALYSLTLVTGASSGFLMVFDAAALPSNGAVTPVWCIPVIAASGYAVQWQSPLVATTGVVAAFSTGANCDTLTASATAKFMGQAL